MSDPSHDDSPIGIRFASQAGGERVAYVVLTILDNLDGGSGAVTTQITSHLIRPEGQRYLRYMSADELHVETLELMLDISRGKPIFPIFR